MSRWLSFKIWLSEIAYDIGLTRRFKKAIRTRDFLIHEYLRQIDAHEVYPIREYHTDTSVAEIADMLLEVSGEKAQEIYDEIMVLGLAEHVDKNGFYTIVLTDAGKKRLFHSYYLKEHNKLVWKVIREGIVMLITFLLALAPVLQTCSKKSDPTLEPLRNIDTTLRGIGTTLENTRFSIVTDSIVYRDTVFVHDTVFGKKP